MAQKLKPYKLNVSIAGRIGRLLKQQAKEQGITLANHVRVVLADAALKKQKERRAS